MSKQTIKRSLAFILAICTVVSLLPMTVIARDTQVGDSVTTDTKEPPAAVENAVWVLTDSIECKKIVHTHEGKCFYQSCDHKDGHLPTCYSEATAYSLCNHEDETQHTGSVTLTDVVEINGRTVSWKTSHPAYSVVYGIYKAAYDEAYNNAKFGKDLAGRIAGIAALTGKTFCYTTSASAEPNQCTHGECSDYKGDCYTKICILEEHEHEDACFQYTWTLKADLNKNGVADDADQYYVVKYVNEGQVIYEEAILVGMPTPTVDAPSKPADQQYTYKFVGWDVAIADTVTENVTYTAVYTSAVNKYTVTWLDEDGTELEVDKDVEYGQMPSYDGKLPEKQGNTTVVYTFAGWTPSVDTVTGDVTYTATYTTRSVFEVKFFIDGELQKTEYVVDGESVPVYMPSREHYKLSAWMKDEQAYNFSDKVTGPVELHASWELVESVITVKTTNATSSWNSNDVCKIGETAVIEFTPKDGYAISKVLVNKKPATVTYDDGVVTLYITPNNETELYIVEVQTEKVHIKLDAAEMNVFGDLSASAIFNAVYDEKTSYPKLSASDVQVEYLAFSLTLMDKTYEWWVEPGTDVSIEAFLNQYGLGSLANYLPKDNLPHEFGAQATEQVRISFAGNEKYPAVSAQTTVALIDLRTPTSITLNENVVVVYGATEEDVLKQVFKNVVSENAVVTENYQDVTITVSSLNAGEQTATVAFNGNKDYAASVAEVTFTVKKAASKVEVESYNGKYGTSVNVSELITSNANNIQVVLGAQLGANASADAGTVAYVNLPALIDLDAIENETIRNILQKALDKATEGLSGTMSVTQLRDALEAALPYLKTAEEYGYTANLTPETIEAVIMVLNKMAEAEEIQNLTVNVTFDKDIVLDNAGVYLIAAVTSDMNYTVAFGAGYVVITPDGYRANLSWNIEDENGIVTIEALRNGYDLGASVTSVLEGNIEDANAHVYTLFFGVNKNGEMVLTKNQKELDIGAYTELAFIVDFGNTMYYAEPIMRAFVVAADIVNVQFVDQNGNFNNDRIFQFGENATMYAVALDRVTGDVENGTMTYMYMGLQANGEMYRGTTAPTRPGVYTVVAVFVGEDEMTIGMGVGTLAIDSIVPDFSTEDKTVQYDGNEHNVTIKDSTGMSLVYVIMDEYGNVNVVMPQQLTDFVLTMGGSLEEVLNKLDDVLLPPEVYEYCQQLADTIEQLKKDYNVYSITLNDAFPSEVGVYKFTVLGYKDTEHGVVVTKSVLTITCAHEYTNDCDTDCNLCGEPRNVGEHTYDNACDEDCNICGDTREVNKHKETYIDRYESTCVKQGYEKIRCKACHEVLSETKLPLSEEHVYYNGACLLCGTKEHCEHNYIVVKELAPTCVEAGYVWTVCSECGAEKNYEVGTPTGEHGDTYIDRYESTCIKHGYEKTRCKVCHEVLSEIELPLAKEHVYYNGTCLLCGVTETCQHDYVTVRELAPTCGEAGYIWTKCSKCDNEKNYEVGEPTGEHAFDNACDDACNVCGENRKVGPHEYQNACDVDCDICGATREVGDHKYFGSENKAPGCGEAGEKTYVCSECGHSYTESVPATGDHTYDNNCDTTCNNCEHVREVGEHVYDNDCDDECNECGEDRIPADHIYDNACDADCNVCGAVRDTEEHIYTNNCDVDCDVCGATREPSEHVYDNACDNTCNLCGEAREVGEHMYDDEYDADCNECGALRDVPTKPAPEEPVPGTSDISIGLVTSLMTISCVALVVLMLSKKQFLYTGKYSK